MTFISIDLKSFFASAECVERGLDPFKTHLVVADNSRTDKTICLAVSPALKELGIPGRPRLFEVKRELKALNYDRAKYKSGKSSFNADVLNSDPAILIEPIIATPQMALYKKISSQINRIYQRFFSKDDIHIYSIDEVFIDYTPYEKLYELTARQITTKIIATIYKETGITATAGIGTNIYLAKVAMDILAKKAPPDRYGARISELDEQSYKEQLWAHKPLKDFWRVGKATAKKLAAKGIYTMGDIAERALYNEDMFFKMFGKNAELLIDHAFGIEPVRMSDIKNYKPHSKSIGSGQVLHRPYSVNEARIIVGEMSEALALRLVSQKSYTDHIVVHISYDTSSVTDDLEEITTDRYGRAVPKPSHGSITLDSHTNLTSQIAAAAKAVYDKISNPTLLIRKVYISLCRLRDSKEKNLFEFADEEASKKEQSLTNSILKIKNKFGKNAILKGNNFKDGATMRERNEQIGGHRA